MPEPFPAEPRNEAVARLLSAGPSPEHRVDPFWMRIALGNPQQCHEDDACEQPAIALRIDPEEDQPYAVCRDHIGGDMVTLERIVRFMLDHHEAQRIAIRGLVRIAAEQADGDGS